MNSSLVITNDLHYKNGNKHGYQKKIKSNGTVCEENFQDAKENGEY